MIIRFPCYIRCMFSKATALMVLTGNILAAELQLIPEQSTLRYAAMKYGTMQVNGFLTETGKEGLSGRVLLEQAGTDYHVFGEINLERVTFDSQHARRDDEVSALFKTPLRLTLSSHEHLPCSPELGQCALNVGLELNQRIERFEQNVFFFRDQRQLKAEGELTIAREAFDLVFKEGFASTLDVAVSSEIAVYFSLAFEGMGVIEIVRLPERLITTNDENSSVLEQGKDESVEQGSKQGILNRVRAWLESF